MKILNTFRPASSTDTIDILTSSSHANFPSTNLKDIKPTKSWKTNNTITESWVRYDFGTIANHADLAFINRINFANFTLQRSNNGSAWTNIEVVTGLTTDEIDDEKYIHRAVEIGTATFRYLRLLIPAQTPLFEQTYFKVGNFLAGKATEIWNPKDGFSITIDQHLNTKNYPSGYVGVKKIGKSKRIFTGILDKVKFQEYLKFINSYQPFVLLLDFDSDLTSSYLVRYIGNQTREYNFAKIVTVSFSFQEIV